MLDFGMVSENATVKQSNTAFFFRNRKLKFTVQVHSRCYIQHFQVFIVPIIVEIIPVAIVIIGIGTIQA